MDDPYLWLEDVHGAKAAGLGGGAERPHARRGRIRSALPATTTTPRCRCSTPPTASRTPRLRSRQRLQLLAGRDASRRACGGARRSPTTRRPRRNGRSLLDIDKLAADEKENWVFEGSDCTPRTKRCLISLSRGGGDAAVVREFDLTTQSASCRTASRCPKPSPSASFVDDDTVLFGTDFGPGSMTTSGYPRIVKLWKRGQKIADAKTLSRKARRADIAVQTRLRDRRWRYAHSVR